MIDRFAEFISRYGPRADLLGFLSSACSCTGVAVGSIQELVLAAIYAREDVRDGLLLATSNEVDDTVRRAWPLATTTPRSGKPFIGSAQMEAGFRPVYVS